ncbi:MAG: DUF4261 domain-containing protein [Planctomycetales bacterium]|nr:DUF4261 domain-containing protein [Planctomycetales bacterium]
MPQINRWIALLPLAAPQLPNFAGIERAFQERFPDAVQPSTPGGTERLTTCSLGDFTASATLIDQPIPPAQLVGPCAAAWYWPDAAAAVSNHTAHLLLTLVDEGGTPIDRALAFTRWTAAVAAASDALGVFWGPSRAIHRPADFIDQAVQSSINDLPLYLWIDFRIEPVANATGGPGFLRLYTTGLEALGQNELEVQHFVGEPQTLLSSAYNVAHYLLERKKVINDGDTIGLTEEVQLTARRGPSMLGGELEVIQLQWE